MALQRWKFVSGIVMYPAGLARNTTADLRDILDHKFNLLSSLSVADGASANELVAWVEALPTLTPAGDMDLYKFELGSRPGYE